MSVLEVKELCKSYPGFALDNVSFSLEPGKITGFIGRNGAGKSTTLKAMLNFVHPDSGSADFFGKPFVGNEIAVKSDIGFVSGGFEFYPLKKLKSITKSVASFYPEWNSGEYERYMKLFSLDDGKTPSKLSAGMKVKYALTLALSHNARLLILDEPTSGLDPVSRDELLEIFMELADRGVTILFSTHITSDLDKCADNIIYIHSGKIVMQCTLEQFRSRYMLVTGNGEYNGEVRLIGKKRAKSGYTALIECCDRDRWQGDAVLPDLEEIMVHLEREYDRIAGKETEL